MKRLAAACLVSPLWVPFFAALWAGADPLGRKIERERAEAWAAYRAEHG